MTDLPPQDLSTDANHPWWRLRAGWTYAALLAGELTDHDKAQDTGYPLTLESLGTLALPDGAFVAADPYVMDDEPQPFAQRLGVESVEVLAARALVGEDHERVAALVLKAGGGTVVDWVMATLPGQDVGALEPEQFYGYGVDAGTGSFGGTEAMKVTGRVLSEDAGMLDDPISAALFADNLGTRSAVLVAPEPGAAPVAVCSSGWGDGFYATWLGISAAGEVVVVVTDFMLTGDPYSTPASRPEQEPLPDRVQPPAPKRWWRRIFGA